MPKKQVQHRDAVSRCRAHAAGRQSGHAWRLWLAGTGAVALFLGGALLFASRAGYVSFQLPATTAEAVELRNELAGATSPYLRSAAEQPVAWQQWGPETFALARKTNRPIWLDIGAVWCHWCHVMDRESYEDLEVAALINRDFVPVKVDRDERPDIDQRYQNAHRLLNNRGGGWPLTMFLTPDGIPFAGGTYYPPRARGGRPGIRDIAARIAGAYHSQPDRVSDVSARVQDAFAAMARGASSGGTLAPGLARAIARDVKSQFDPEYGGFGRGPGPKFPGAEAVELALAAGYLDGDREMIERALATLDAYAASGMRDFVNGGFFRYSTDRALTVPHFEKMDYVQAALLRAYLAAYRLTGAVRYADVVRHIMRYVDTTLSDREAGGFYPHQDADLSLDDDGSYYTWSVEELERAVPDADTVRALRLRFDIDEAGEPMAVRGENVLRVVRGVSEVAEAMGIGVARAGALLAQGLEAMHTAMQPRPAPFVEQTKYTDRNAMMIGAYLDAWATLGDERARTFALKSLEFVLAHALQKDGTVRHATADGRSYVPGLVSDYAFLADTLADAFQVTGEQRYLDTAQRLMDRAVALFRDGEHGGFFDRAHDPKAPALLASRHKEFTDTPEPGANAVAARVLNKLYLLTMEPRWQARAEETLAAFAGSAGSAGRFAASYALAVEAFVNQPAQTVVIGPADSPLSAALADAAWRAYRPGRLVARYDPARVNLDELPKAVAGAARAFRGDPTPRAFVCVGNTCAPPTSAPDRVVELVSRYGLETVALLRDTVAENPVPAQGRKTGTD